VVRTKGDNNPKKAARRKKKKKKATIKNVQTQS